MNITFSLILLAVSSAGFAWFAYSNRKSSFWTLRVVSGVVWFVLFVAIDILATLGVIPWLVAICLFIIAGLVNGSIALLLMRLILGPTRFANMAARAHFEQLEERKKSGSRKTAEKPNTDDDSSKPIEFVYRDHLIEISDYDPLYREKPGGFEYKVKIDGQDRTTSVMTWPAAPDPDDPDDLFGAPPVRNAKLFIDWAHGGKGP